MQIKLSNKAYDIYKVIGQVLLPAAGTLYFTLSEIWGLPYPDKIIGTIAATNTFLGVILQISSATYYKQQEEEQNYYENCE